MSKSSKIHNLIILGSGPAGLTAAIYAARASLAPLLIHGSQPGGQLTTTTTIENFPGFPDGIDGPTLMERMEQQAQRFGTTFLHDHVIRADVTSRPFRLWTNNDQFLCRSLIIATGSTPRKLGLPNEVELYGRGVSVCATCDGFFYKGQQVVIVGGGDTAIEEAVFLARFAEKVTVIHRRDTLRATPMLQEAARKEAKIHFCYNSVVTEILEAPPKGVCGVKIRHLPDGKEENLPCHGVFIAIGHIPNTDLFEGQLNRDDNGYLLTNQGTDTNIDGVFASGDVRDPQFRQAITAAGTGCQAAMQAERYLARSAEK